MASLGRAEAEAGTLRELTRDLNALVEKQASLIGQQRDELRTLKGENVIPSRGCHIAHIVVADITAAVEFDYEPAERAVYDVDSPACGPGCPESIEPLRIYLNGRWCDLTDVCSALTDDALVQAISDTRSDE